MRRLIPFLALGLIGAPALAQETVSLRCTVTSKSWTWVKGELTSAPTGPFLPVELNFDITGRRAVSVEAWPKRGEPNLWTVDASQGFYILHRSEKQNPMVESFSARIDRATGIYTLDVTVVQGIMRSVHKTEGPCEKREPNNKF